VVRANLAALEGRLQERLINVGTGVATSTRELATQLVLIARPEVLHDLDAGPPRPGDVEYTVLDNTRFKLALGNPTPLEEGLRETYAWFRSQIPSSAAAEQPTIDQTTARHVIG
jgi:UDP-glucose 4-epimerase